MRALLNTAWLLLLWAPSAQAACDRAREWGCAWSDVAAPSGGGTTFRYAPSFERYAEGTWALGADVHASLDSLTVTSSGPSNATERSATVHERLETTLRASYAATSELQLHVALPFVIAQSGWAGARSGSTASIESQAFGDVRAGLSWNRSISDRWGVFSRIDFSAPTATSDAFFGARGTVFVPAVGVRIQASNKLSGYAAMRARYDLGSREAFDAPSAFVGFLTGVNLSPWTPSFGLHIELAGYRSLQSVAPAAQDRAGFPRLDLGADPWVPTLLSAGTSVRDAICNKCNLHASVGTAISFGQPNPGAPLASFALRFEKTLR